MVRRTKGGLGGRMRHAGGLLATVLAGLLPAIRTLADERQHNNVIFTPPAGWTVGAVDDRGNRILYWDGEYDECPGCRILISTGANGGGDLARWVASQAGRFADEDGETVEPVGQPSSMTEGTRTVLMQAQKVDTGDIRVLIGLASGRRLELIAFEGSAYDAESLEKSMQALSTSVTPMVTGLRLVSEGAAPLMAPPSPGALAGPWWGWTQDWGMQLDGTMMLEMRHRTLVFWPEGLFYEGAPPAGSRPLEPAMLMASGDGAFGSYRVEGASLHLDYADGREETLAAEDDGWSDGAITLSKVAWPADGSRIEGTLSSFFYSGFTPGSGVSGGVSSGNYTAFSADGTYEGESYGGAFGNFETATGDLTGGFSVSGGDGETRGTYEIRDGLLIQTPAGGVPVAVQILNADDMILIGERILDTGED
jgi:hypothetical protein